MNRHENEEEVKEGMGESYKKETSSKGEFFEEGESFEVVRREDQKRGKSVDKWVEQREDLKVKLQLLK